MALSLLLLLLFELSLLLLPEADCLPETVADFPVLPTDLPGLVSGKALSEAPEVPDVPGVAEVPEVLEFSVGPVVPDVPAFGEVLVLALGAEFMAELDFSLEDSVFETDIEVELETTTATAAAAGLS